MKTGEGNTLGVHFYKTPQSGIFYTSLLAEITEQSNIKNTSLNFIFSYALVNGS